jgi:hypothetical protein
VDQRSIDTGEQYWASVEPDQLPDVLAEKAQLYFQHLDETGRIELWRRSTRAYYGFDPKGGWSSSAAISFGGEQGELSKVRENHYRSLIEHIHVMGTGDRPAYQARAMRATYDALQQAELANKLLDYFLTEKRIEDACTEAAEHALIYGEGWLSLTWDHAAGEQYGVQEVPLYNDDGTEQLDDQGQPKVEEQVVYEGDIKARVHHPLRVIRDSREHIKELRWIILLEEVNRWDLIAEYPEHEEQIKEAGAPHYVTRSNLFDHSVNKRSDEYQPGDSDKVHVLTFYHAKTPAMPDGRHAQVCGDVWLFDGPLPYEEIPVHPIVPAVEMQSGHGYGRSWDLLCLQEALDSTATAILSNHDALGVQNIVAPEGANVLAKDIARNLRLLEYPQGMDKPESLDLLQIKPEQFELLTHWQRAMETLSGVNQVARGNPEREMSGSAMALIHAMAIKFNNGFQKSYIRLLEQVGTSMLKIIRSFADTPRVAEIAGPEARPKLVTFHKDSVKDVSRVAIELGNPIQRTTAGKVQLADQMLEKYMGTPYELTPAQYLQVIKTGNYEPLYESERSERMNIQQENEALGQGQDAPVLKTDRHDMHIREHLAILQNPLVREDEQIAGAVLSHIQEHAGLWAQVSFQEPWVLAATGMPPAPPPQGMAPVGGPPGGPQGAPGGGGPGGGPLGGGGPPQGGQPPQGPQQGGGQQQANVPGAGGQDNMPNMPNAPTNPLSGEKGPAANPQGGGQ